MRLLARALIELYESTIIIYAAISHQGNGFVLELLSDFVYDFFDAQHSELLPVPKISHISLAPALFEDDLLLGKRLLLHRGQHPCVADEGTAKHCVIRRANQ